MTKEDKKALRDRLAKRTKEEMDALWSNPDFRREHAIWKQEYNAAVAMHEARQKADAPRATGAPRRKRERAYA